MTLPADEQEILDHFNCRSRIIRNMALTFFKMGWPKPGDHRLDQFQFECIRGQVALKTAHKLADEMEAYNAMSLPDIMLKAARETLFLSSSCAEKDFGHYAAMHAMGDHMGLEAIGIPYYHYDMPYIGMDFVNNVE